METKASVKALPRLKDFSLVFLFPKSPTKRLCQKFVMEIFISQILILQSQDDETYTVTCHLWNAKP